MSFRWPVDNVKVTQGFGENPDYYKQFGQIGHNGIDIGVPLTTPVYAADDGVISYEGWGQNHSWAGVPAGIWILLDNGGSYSGYAHLNKTVVSKGDRVVKGQLIGYSGSTGAATGPHVHFEMLPKNPNFKNGYAGRINITPYIETNTQGGTTVAIIENAENWRGRVNATFKAIRGRYMGDGEFDQFIGKDTLALIESLEDNPEATANANYADLGRRVASENWGQQLADKDNIIATKTTEAQALADENAKLKANQGGVDQETKDNIKETNAIVKWIQDVVASVFNRSK